MSHKLLHLALISLAALSLLPFADAALIIVRPGESIQAAVNGAAAGDVISVQSGIYRESLNISKPLLLEGSGRPQIDGGAARGAVLLHAGGAGIYGFDIKTARRTGILVLSDGNVIMNNTVSGCLDGVLLEGSASNRILYNDINNNTNGIVLLISDGNIIANNSITNNSINEESDCGIALACSSHNLIQDNDLRDNGDSSLSLRSSVGNTIIGNSFCSNDWFGISLTEFSNNNLIESNIARDNRDSGLHLDSSQANIIRNNKALNNSRGIYLAYDSNDNLLQNNSLSFNGKGLHLATHSSNNTIENNTAIQNGYGIYLSFSCGWNLIFANHLLENGYSAYDMGQNNRWDNGTIGNYYSDLGETFYIPGGPGVDRHPMPESMPM